MNTGEIAADEIEFSGASTYRDAPVYLEVQLQLKLRGRQDTLLYQGHNVFAAQGRDGLHLHEFLDSAGISWTVRRIWRTASSFGPIRDDLDDGWLLLECPQELRRCAPVPQFWHSLAPAAFAALCASASAARPTPGMLRAEAEQIERDLL